MAAENFKVKKGLEVGTAITATSSGVNVTGIVTATQFVGDGSGLTGVTGSGSGVVVKDEGSAVGTAGTVNFVGSGVAATLSSGTATVTINRSHWSSPGGSLPICYNSCSCLIPFFSSYIHVYPRIYASLYIKNFWGFFF